MLFCICLRQHTFTLYVCFFALNGCFGAVLVSAPAGLSTDLFSAGLRTCLMVEKSLSRDVLLNYLHIQSMKLQIAAKTFDG